MDPARDAPPLYVLSRDAARRLDEAASQEFLVPSILLMENAARHVADVALELVEDVDRPGALIVCGPGNNGGDGLAAARHLHNAGLHVGLLLAGPASACAGDPGVQLAIVSRMGLRPAEMDLRDPAASLARACEALPRLDLIVDAVLGTGLQRPVIEPLASLLEAMNRRAGPRSDARRASGDAPSARMLAVDVPSGLDADTGEPLGVAVAADVTVTFVGIKPGFLRLESQAWVGEVVVADIGAPRELVERFGTRINPGRRGTPPDPGRTPRRAAPIPARPTRPRRR